MRVSHDVNESILSNVGVGREFKINNSSRAFSILSSGLYSNKIRAIIRELSCNALDSHVAAGKADVPFEVHLPTVLEPWFAVKDYGLGLDHDQVTNIYTIYFESTKTNSNDFIGALGLGSKSPFSYTQNFTVTAVKDGVERIYSAYVNELGIPCAVPMCEELTDAANGVEVKFSVTDRHDYYSFRYESNSVFMWFKNKPIITGVSDYTHQTPDYKEENIVPGVHVRQAGNGSLAIMGNIAYPLINIPEPEKHFGQLAELLSCNLVFEFNIGELDFAVSREELSYIPLTIASIKRKLEEVSANLSVHVAKTADAITCEWARAVHLQVQSRARLYSSAVKQYVIDTKFELYDANIYNGRKSFNLDVEDLTTRGLDIKMFLTHNSSCSIVRAEFDRATSKYSYQVPVSDNVVIVFNNLKTGIQSRARYHFAKQNKRVFVVCVSHSDPDLAMRQVEYEKLKQELHNPPDIMMASQLSVKEKPAKSIMSNQGILKMTPRGAYCRGYNDFNWEPYKSELVSTETYYYICLNNYAPEHPDGKPLNMDHIGRLMLQSGIPALSGLRVMGVRKNRIKDIKGLSNWVWIEDKLREETAKITDAHIATLVAAEVLDGYYTRTYTNKNVARLVGPDSLYNKYMTEVESVKRAEGDVTQLSELCTMYGNVVEIGRVKQHMIDAKTKMLARYPMLQFINSRSDVNETVVAEYIKLIDKQENTPNE